MRFDRKQKRVLAAVSLIGLIVVLSVLQLPRDAFESPRGLIDQNPMKGGGFGDGNFDFIDGGNCAGTNGCHGLVTTRVPIGILFNPVSPYTPGQSGIQITVTINMNSAAGGSLAGVTLRIGPTGSQPRWGIENDGWSIQSDPNGGTNNYIERSGLVGAGPTNLAWTVTAPAVAGSYKLDATVFYIGTQEERNRTAEQTIVVSAPADNLPPRISTVRINGAATQTYPLSSIPTLTLTGTVDDSATGNSNIGGANYTIGPQTWGTSQPMSLQNPPTSPTEVFTATLASPTTKGTYYYYMYGWDSIPNYNKTNTLEFATLTITDDVPPMVSDVFVDGQALKGVLAGTIVTLTATANDTLTGNSNIGGANYTVGAASWPGTGMNALTPPFDSPMEGVTQTIDTTGWSNGIYNIYVYAWDNVPNYNATSGAYATLVIATEVIPPEISNVRINGAATQTYPLSSIPTLTLTGTVDDSATGNSDIGGANFTIGPQMWGTSAAMTMQSPPTSPTEVFTATLTAPAAAGTYMYYVYGWDELSNCNTTNNLAFATLTIVDDLPPEVSSVLANGQASVTVSAGTSVTLTATIDDSNTGGSNVAGANYTTGQAVWPGASMSASNPPFNSVLEAVTVSLDTTGWPIGTYHVYVYGWDDKNNLNLTSAAFATINIGLTVNSAPVLAWTGEVNYAGDGLNPESGNTSTSFVYRVRYTDSDNDAPAIGDPKVHIKKGGTEISGSPFSMNFVGGTFSGGAFYTIATILAAGTDYTYYFTASDSKGAPATPTTEKDAPDVAWADTTPPDAPEDVAVHSTSASGQLVVSWNPNSESDLVGYRIYRSETPGSGFISVGYVGSVVTSFTDSGLVDGKTYYYVITAFDASGNESPRSDEVQGISKAPAQTRDEIGMLPLWWLLVIVVAVIIFYLFLILLWRRTKKKEQATVPPTTAPEMSTPEDR